jgi:hypothetical protein
MRRIPENPTTRPATWRRVSVSPSHIRAKRAAKNGALFRRTDATAAPARFVPSAMPASVRTTFPVPIAHAQAHPRHVPGSCDPTIRRTGSITRPPTRARAVAITDALVR